MDHAVSHADVSRQLSQEVHLHQVIQGPRLFNRVMELTLWALESFSGSLAVSQRWWGREGRTVTQGILGAKPRSGFCYLLKSVSQNLVTWSHLTASKLQNTASHLRVQKEKETALMSTQACLSHTIPQLATFIQVLSVTLWALRKDLLSE